MFELFIKESCPYCKKVMQNFNKNGIEYEKKDVNDEENMKTLLELGGKDQVPFLYSPDNDVRLYESSDIIEYAKYNPQD